MEAREPADNDLELFDEIESGDVVKFFEWAVEPLTVVGREDDEEVGERVRVEAEGSESFIYEVDGNLWYYTPEEDYEGENNPFPVQNLVRVDTAEA